jgi:hypothetical protein
VFKKAYLAGPMSGVPQFNFPEFYRVAALLRGDGWDIISPAELDDEQTAADALKSAAGDPVDQKPSWGDFLARDVKIVADEVKAIIFLPGWEKSRGAKLEAFTGLLTPGFLFFKWVDDTVKSCVEQIDPRSVIQVLTQEVWQSVDSYLWKEPS